MHTPSESRRAIPTNLPSPQAKATCCDCSKDLRNAAADRPLSKLSAARSTFGSVPVDPFDVVVDYHVVVVRHGVMMPSAMPRPHPQFKQIRSSAPKRGDMTRSVFGPPSRGRTRSDCLSLKGCQVSAHIEGVEQCIRSYIEGVVGMSNFTPWASTQPLNVRQLRQGNDVGE